MNMQSEWAGTAALLRHYHEVRTRLRTPPNAVPDAGINLKHNQLEQKTQLEPPPSPRMLPSEDQQRITKYLHAYQTSFRRNDDYISIRTAINFVAKELGLTRSAVMSRTKTANLVFARQVAVYLTIKHTTYTRCNIAHYLHRDHSTVFQGQKTIAKIMAEGGPKAAKINDIETKLLAAFPRAALSTFYKQPVAVESWAGPQVPAVHPVDS